MTPRAYDIILFGATGFTGQLTAEYLLKQPTPLRWALAGRNADKLTEIQQNLLVDYPQATAPDIVLADSHDPQSLQRLCAQAKVIISTVGPYMLHGEALVAACVEQGCDYVDLTGEPEFVALMRQRYGAKASAKGVKIVNCCGFDSIPHDLGVLFTIMEMSKRLGADTLSQAHIKVSGYVRGHGDISGGTWNSAVNAMSGWKSFLRDRQKKYKQIVGKRTLRLVELPILKRMHDGWAAPLPTIDPAIVVDSARYFDQYGQQFSYAHFAVTPQLRRIIMTSAALSGIFALAQFSKGREWLGNRRPSGVGPTPEQRAEHWFSVDFVAEANNGKPLLVLRTQVSGGDPGYDETAKMLAESALCLLHDQARLPANFGVITPAAAMGEVLIERLQNAGIKFELKN